MHIIGASGHAKVIVDILRLNDVSISGIWDDNDQLETFNKIKVSGSIRSFFQSNYEPGLIAIGNNRIRKKIATQLTIKFGFAKHPSCVISQSARINDGTVIMANVVVNADAVIGHHVILNTSSSIDHDCIIEDYAHISPQVGLAGNVFIGEGSHIGIGASIIQGIKVGKWATIGAGAVIINDVPDFAVVVGNPGRIIKYSKENE